MNPVFPTSLALFLALAGCGRKESPTPPAPAPETKAVTVDSAPESAPPPPAAAPEAPPSATPAPETDTAVGSDLANVYVNELQSIVDSYVAVTKRKPTDLSQLISAGFLPAMPAAPAGKKYALDPATTKVKLVNR
jgi:hypothetical protein